MPSIILCIKICLGKSQLLYLLIILLIYLVSHCHGSDGKENIVFPLFILYYCYNKNKSLGTGFWSSDEAAYSD